MIPLQGVLRSSKHIRHPANEVSSGWYVIRGSFDGPYDNDSAKQLSQMGRIAAHALVWRVGEARWATAREVPPFGRPRDRAERWWLTHPEISEVVQGLEKFLSHFPAHKPSYTALRKICDSGRDHGRAAEMLEPWVREQNDWVSLAELVETRLGRSRSKDERQRARLELVALHGERMNRYEAAFEFAADALGEDPNEETAPPLRFDTAAFNRSDELHGLLRALFEDGHSAHGLVKIRELWSRV